MIVRNEYIIKMFFNSAPPYLTCFSATKKTCDAVALERATNVNERECKNACNQNSKCNFVFLTELKTCLLFETCESERTAIFNGTTYGKSICPGRLFFTVKYTTWYIHVIFT